MAAVVVVGAGLGGLATAVRLCAAGHRVTVLEQSDQVGGKCGRIEVDGFVFDTGPSLLTLPAVYRDLFATTGRALDKVLDLVPVDPVCHYRFADGTILDMPNASRGRIGAALDGSLGPGAGQQWLDLLTRGGQIWAATRDPFLSTAHTGAGSLARLARANADMRTVAPHLSLRALGERYLEHPHLRTLLDRYATYAGSDPRSSPAAFATIPYVEQAFGGWYVRGGLNRLATATAERAQQLDAEIRTGTKVHAVSLDGRRVDGVVLDDGAGGAGALLRADVVVSSVDARHLYRDLVPDSAGRAARSLGTRLSNDTASSSGFVLMLGLRGRTPGLGHHTVLFGPDYDDEFDALFGTGSHAARPRPVVAPTIYLSAPDDETTRPDDDSQALFALVNAPVHSPGDPRRGVDWDATGLAGAYGDRVLALMAERGVDVRDRVVVRRHMTPADLERRTGSVGGAIYGQATRGGLGPFRRPTNASPVPGLYLVGGSTHPGGGLPLVGMSAEIVAGLIGSA